MKTKETAIGIFVGVAAAMMVSSASATTDATVVRSRSSDECYAALTDDWTKLAQLQGKENQSSEPLVVVTQAPGTRKD